MVVFQIPFAAGTQKTNASHSCGRGQTDLRAIQIVDPAVVMDRAVVRTAPHLEDSSPHHLTHSLSHSWTGLKGKGALTVLIDGRQPYPRHKIYYSSIGRLLIQFFNSIRDQF